MIALFKYNFVKNVRPFVLQTTECAIPLQKQPAVPSRHGNVRHVYYYYCIRQGTSMTNRHGSFQQQKKHQTNDILNNNVKDKFTETNGSSISLQMDTSKQLLYDICCQSSSTLLFTVLGSSSASNPRCKSRMV